LPTSQFSEAPHILDAIGTIDPELKPLIAQAGANIKSPCWNDDKVTAHHGIIPTGNKSVSLSAMSDSERKVYDLIRRYYLAQFMGDYTYQQRTVEVNAVDETFTAGCIIPKEPGWKRAISSQLEDSDETEALNNGEAETSIPKLNKGDGVNAIDNKVLAKQTKPPGRFTEGSLITAMKHIAKFVDDPELKKTLRDTAGIGTEATRADIIEKLILRGFIDRNKKQLISTERGRELIEIVPHQMKDPGTTALWEQALDDIANGKGDLETFLYDQEDILSFMLEDLAELRKTKKGASPSNGPVYPCPKCQSPLAKRKGKKGYFWSCTRYPDCDGILSDQGGKPVARAEASGIDCPECKQGKLVRRVGKKGHWWGCNAYPTCKATFFDNKGKPVAKPERQG
jgi:DNA topoisomerase-3